MMSNRSIGTIMLFCDERRARRSMVLHSAKSATTKAMTCYTTERGGGEFIPPGKWVRGEEVWREVYPAHARCQGKAEKKGGWQPSACEQLKSW